MAGYTSPGDEPVGGRINLGGPNAAGDWMKIMGVVGEIGDRDLVMRYRNRFGRTPNRRVRSIFLYQRVRTRAVGPDTDGLASARKHAQPKIHWP